MKNINKIFIFISIFFVLVVMGFLSVKTVQAYITPEIVATRFDDPRDLAIASDGSIFVVDYERNFLGVVRPGDPNRILLISNLNRPAGLAFDSSGNLYFTERAAGTLKMIPAATLSDNNKIAPEEIITILTGLSSPADVTVYPTTTDRVYFAQNTKPGAIRYYDAGTETVTTVLTGLDYPWSVAVRSDGVLIYSELGKNRVQSLSPGETIPETVKIWGPVYGLSFDSNDNAFFTLGISQTTFGILGEVFAYSNAGTGIYATEGNMRVPVAYEGYVYWGEQAGYPNGRILKIPIPETSYAQIVNGNTGGTIETDFGDVMTIPAGAYSGNETITLDIGSIPDSLDPADIIIPRTYTFGPSPLILSPSITMSWHYVRADLKGRPASELRVYYYDTSTESWVYTAGTIDEVAQTLTVSIDHFSTFGVFAAGSEGEVGAPEIPFRPYSIEWLPSFSNVIITTGQTLPISFALTDIEGNFMADQSVKVRVYDDQGNSTEWFDAVKKERGASYVRVFENSYRLNLNTKNYSWIIGGELYTLEVRFDDVRSFTLKFPVKEKHNPGNLGLGLYGLFGGIGGLMIGFLVRPFVKRPVRKV